MLMGVSGCAASPAPQSAARSCDASLTQALVGQPETSEAAAQAQRLSGAGIVRWLQPGQIITMEFRADRLNLVLDARSRIESIRCG
jgi:hypothetical protein